MRSIGLILLSFLALIPLSGVAQPPEWEIFLYDGLQIHVLTAQGISRTLPVPSGAQGIVYPVGVSNHYFSFIRLSPDHRYLVFADTHTPDDMPHTASLEIADFANQSCCFALPTPFPGHANIIIVGPFSPDGTQVAAVIARENADWASAVVTVALESGQVTAQLSPLETPAINQFGVFFGEWDEAGIQIIPTCYACDGGIYGPYLRWQPMTGQLTPDTGYFHWAGDTLAATGEHIRPADNPNYPASAEPGGGPWWNTIDYVPMEGISEVVYHDRNDLQLGDVHWVMDGQAYLLYPSVIFRDGTQRNVEFPIVGDFIVGTPDGWVMQGRSLLPYPIDTPLYHYRYQDGVLSANELGYFPRRVAVLDAPALGASATTEITPVIH